MSDRRGGTHRGKGVRSGGGPRPWAVMWEGSGSRPSHPVNIYRPCQAQTHRHFLDLIPTYLEQVHKLSVSCDFYGFSIHLCLEPGARLGQFHGYLDWQVEEQS